MSEIEAEVNGSDFEIEEPFRSNLFSELLLSQREAIRCIGLAYLAPRDEPEISRQVRQIAEDVQNQHFKTHSLVKEYEVTALHVVNAMIPFIELGVRQKNAPLIQKGIQKLLTYVDHMTQKIRLTQNEYDKVRADIVEEISNIENRNEVITQSEIQELNSCARSIEQELLQLKIIRDKGSVQAQRRENFVSLFSAILQTGVTTFVTKIGHAIIKARAQQACQQAIEAWQDIQKGQDKIDENDKRILKMREEAIQKLVAMAKLALEKANQMNEESLKLAGRELGKVAQLFAKIVLFWDDFSAKLTALSKSHGAVEQFIEFIHDPELAEDIDESVRQVKKVWNSFGIMCTCYVNESEEHLGELYAFMSHPVYQMTVTECQNRTKELIEAHRQEIKELESMIV